MLDGWLRVAVVAAYHPTKPAINRTSKRKHGQNYIISQQCTADWLTLWQIYKKKLTMKRSCDSESHRSANFNFTKLVPAYTLNLHGIVCPRLSDPRIQVVGHAHLTHLGFPTKRSEKN